MISKLLLVICLLLSSIKGIDSSKIRYGNTVTFEKGQTVYLVDSKKIYENMTPYKTIIKEKLKEDSARYTKLMQKCTALYKTALDKSGYPLIVEIDGVDKTLHKTEDVTNKLISLL